jgi:hypothetical protein
MTGSLQSCADSNTRVPSFGAVEIGCHSLMPYRSFLKLSLLAISGASALLWFAVYRM